MVKEDSRTHEIFYFNVRKKERERGRRKLREIAE